MTDDLMRDKNQPAPETGTVTNVLTRQQMRATVVEIRFIPKKKNAPPQTPRRIRFGTTVLAQEFIEQVNPKVVLGSPKQAAARKAKLVKLQPHLMPLYDIQVEIVAQGAEPSDHGGIEIDGPEPDDEVLDTFAEPTTTGDEPDETPDNDNLIDGV